MPAKEYYLGQARMLGEMAAKMNLLEDAAKLIKRAKEYELLAEAMPFEPTPPPCTPITIPMQQQQQGPTKEDQDDKERRRSRPFRCEDRKVGRVGVQIFQT
jgi:hypothetical protein